MPCKKKKVVQRAHSSPAQKSAKAVSNKYKLKGKRMSPRKKMAVRRALYSKPDESIVLAPTKKEMVLRYSVINGYHFFQTRPPNFTPPTQLLVQPEYTNIHDECASLVWLPELDFIPNHMHSLLPDEKRQLKLQDVAGLPIGHVPRNLAGFFRPLMESGHIVAAVTGEPVPSLPSWPALKEEGGVYCFRVITISHILILKYNIIYFQNCSKVFLKGRPWNLFCSYLEYFFASVFDYKQ
ncbi:uncharacterized protein LOC127853153 [Dreissena polymorpha]|uniref:Uncharacterized protein n=1 Tax=Dreissena polymorpha TaxID=45954 RepID=A0A9D4CQR1_DREPO|nr:uncharacterized protein LOC127853153 [Dreissena polymorpha]XP_052243361.1 uncharacterized protein LOC127853153 [Dreissena polymorpha]KAH3728678.1 hypothetical protein DPMN_054638 [Dreissena polymorpha]